MAGDLALSLVLFALFLFVLFYLYYRAQQRIKRDEALRNDSASPASSPLCRLYVFASSDDNTENVWNISGRMVNHGEYWPTHDHHLNSLAFPPPYQAKDLSRCAPPPYKDVAPPSYDEAVRVHGQLS